MLTEQNLLRRFLFPSCCATMSPTNARHTATSHVSVRLNRQSLRRLAGRVWRCTASGRSPGTDCHHTRGPRWRTPPPGRWGRGSSACTRRRHGAPQPNCSEGRTSSSPPDWRAADRRGETPSEERWTQWRSDEETKIIINHYSADAADITQNYNNNM